MFFIKFFSCSSLAKHDQTIALLNQIIGEPRKTKKLKNLNEKQWFPQLLYQTNKKTEWKRMVLRVATEKPNVFYDSTKDFFDFE